MPSNTNFKAKNGFLTHQHLERLEKGDRDEVLGFMVDHFKDNFAEARSVTVGIEDYPTEEGFHAHSLIEFGGVHTCPRSDFSVKSEDELTTINPFFQSVTCSKASLDRTREYCKKDGLFFTNWEEPTDQSQQLAWSQCLEQPGRAEAQAFLQNTFPRNYVTNYNQIQSFLNGHYPPVVVQYVTPPEYEFTVPEELEEWLVTNLPLPENLVIFHF